MPEIFLTVKHWWKILGILLILYALWMGLTIPVGPGIASIEPNVIDLGEQSVVRTQLYNSQAPEEVHTAWLKNGQYYIEGEGSVGSNGEQIFNFDTHGEALPDSVLGETFALFIFSESDGLFGLPGAVKVEQSKASDKIRPSDPKPEKKFAKGMTFPFRTVLYESIRNLNYHVPMWFTMIILLFVSFISSNLFLVKGDRKYDRLAIAFATTGLLFGLMGITTGSFWARFTWLTFWTRDPKLNGAAIGVLIYVAYFILRNAIEDRDQKGRVAAVYNVFAFPLFIVLIIVIPRLEGFSLHPGSGDSVGFSQYDLDNNLRRVFYPAVVGWILIGTWLSTLQNRILKLKSRIHEDE